MEGKSKFMIYVTPLILGIILVFLVVLFIRQTKKSENKIVNDRAPVSSFDLLTLESFPVQINAVVKGEFPNGCYSLGSIEQTRTDHLFTIVIHSIQSGEMCTQSIVPFQKSIPLDVGGLPKGDYVVNVNGITQSFTLAMDNVLTFNDKSGPESFPYVGKLIAGSTSPFIEFSRADYERALSTGKTVLLYFYAKWCPICKLELSDAALVAFNEYEGDNIIGFRVNYNDSDTDAYERNLAKKFGVLYQHTKVLVRNGDLVESSSVGWTKDDYLEAFISNNQ